MIRNFTFVLLLMTFMLCGCKTITNNNADSKEMVDQKKLEEIKTIDCYGKFETKSGLIITSYGDGIRLFNYPELPSEFSDAIVLLTEKEYYYKGKKEKVQFEVIYSGITGDDSITEYQQNDILGEATGTEVKMCVRSKELNPYLVACDSATPDQYNGYWYYFPGMYSSTEMKWLSYEPVNYDSFKLAYEQINYGHDSPLMMTKFYWWTLLETKLDAYPVPVIYNNVEMYDQTIILNEFRLKLTYPKGFLDYLHDEYKIGNTIYLYLQITEFNGFTKEFSCYVRDFSLESPEDIVQERIDNILSKK